jgi:WD40 repeat protein
MQKVAVTYLLFALIALPATCRAVSSSIEEKPTARLETQVGHTGVTPVNAIAIAPKENLVATAAEGTLVFWDASTTRVLRRIVMPTASIDELQFSPDGSRLLARAFSRQRGLWLIDTKAGRVLACGDSANNALTAAIWSPDGKTIVAAATSSIEALDATTGRQFAQIPAIASGLSFAPDGKLLSVTVLHQIQVWDYPSGHLLSEVTAQAGDKFVNVQKFTRDGRYLVEAGTIPNSHGNALEFLQAVRVYRVDMGALVAELAKTDDYLEIALSPDSRRMLVIGSLYPTLLGPSHTLLWDFAKNQRTDLNAEMGRGSAVFSTDGTRLFGGHFEGCTEWNLDGMRELHDFRGAAASVWTVAVSAESHRLMAGLQDGSVSYSTSVTDSSKSGLRRLSLPSIPPRRQCA